MGGGPNDLSHPNDDDILYGLDGNTHISGGDVSDHAFNSRGIGGHAHGLEFGAGQPGGMNGALDNERPMPFSAQHEQAFNQASMEFGMEGIGDQASGSQPALGRHGVNTVVLSEPMNPEVLQQRVEGMDGQDAEHGDSVDNEMEFDLLQTLSPGTRLSLATLDDSTEAQVSMHETFWKLLTKTVVLIISRSRVNLRLEQAKSTAHPASSLETLSCPKPRAPLRVKRTRSSTKLSCRTTTTSVRRKSKMHEASWRLSD